MACICRCKECNDEAISCQQPHLRVCTSRLHSIIYIETVIEVFDLFVVQKNLDAFAVVVLNNATMHRSRALKRKDSRLDVATGAPYLLVRLLTRAEPDRDSLATDEVHLAATECLSLV